MLILVSEKVKYSEISGQHLKEHLFHDLQYLNYTSSLVHQKISRKIDSDPVLDDDFIYTSIDCDIDLIATDDFDIIKEVDGEYFLSLDDFNMESKDGGPSGRNVLVSEEFFLQDEALSLMQSIMMLGAVVLSQVVSKSNDSDSSKNLLNDPIVNAADLVDMDLRKLDLVDASKIQTIIGSTSDIFLVIQSPGILTSSTYNATVSNTTVAASDLTVIDGDTSGTVDTTAATTITGTAAEIKTAIASSGITTSSTYNATVSNTTVAASDLTVIDGDTSGTVDATAATTITGTAAEIKTAIASSGITTSSTYNATVSDALSVSDANTIDGDTTGIVTGTISDGDLSTLGGLTGTGNAYTITVTDTTVAASDLNTLDGKVSGVLDVALAINISGSDDDIYQLINSVEILTNSSFDVYVDGEGVAVSAAYLRAIDEDTTGIIYVSNNDGLIGLTSDINSVMASNFIYFV